TGIPPYFKRMYVCLADVREGFLDGCRKYLGLDGCFLKGVVNEHLKVDIRTKDGGEWTFMSDKQKGLLNEVQAIFPQAEHRLCARHIYAIWYLNFRGEQMKLAFYSIAKCANEAQLRQRLDEIDSIQTGAKQSLENKDINKWCRAFFKSGTKCDCVDNNSTEAWNYVLIYARSMPIISMNESIRECLMERRIQRINFASKWKLDCGPNIMDIMNENCTAGCKWKIKWNGADEFQVYYGRTQH
nr:elongation factor G, III-V domain-containing protein [Tanacetum cinerariifolium]